MSGHTPGPWFWEEDEDTMQLFGGSGMMPLQLAKCPKKNTPYAEYWPKKEDARLIAVAPDLLEAAKQVLACWNVAGQDFPTPEEEEHFNAAWEDAHQALGLAVWDAEGNL